MADERVTWLLDVKNQASSEFKAVEQNLSSLVSGSGLVKTAIGGLAGALTIAGAVRLGQQVVELAQLGCAS